MRRFKQQALSSASASSGTVVLGPITIEGGKCDVALVAKSASGTVTTPTNPKLQYSPEDTQTIWVDVSSGSVTVSSTSNALAEKTVTGIVCSAIRVVAAGAFAAGNADLYLTGVEY